MRLSVPFCRHLVWVSALCLLAACGQQAPSSAASAASPISTTPAASATTEAVTAASDTASNDDIAVIEFHNNKGDKLQATYFHQIAGEDVQMRVRLTQAGQAERVLPQTEVWSNGAIYSDGTATWDDRDDQGILTVEGQKTKFLRN